MVLRFLAGAKQKGLRYPSPGLGTREGGAGEVMERSKLHYDVDL